MQSNGEIVAVGVTEANNPALRLQPGDFALARYTTTGQLDTMFGTNRLVTTANRAIGQLGPGFRCGLQADGKIVVAGDNTPPAFGDPSIDFVLARRLSQHPFRVVARRPPALSSPCAILERIFLSQLAARFQI